MKAVLGTKRSRGGARVGTIQITAPDMAPVEMALLAGAGVEQLGVLGRLGAAISYLVLGPQKN